jgi:hypothetical protein
MQLKKYLMPLLLSIVFSTQALAETISVGSFNVASGAATASVISSKIGEQKQIKIWGISESSEKWGKLILSTLQQNGNFEIISGTTGIAINRLQIFYDTNAFELISYAELDEINPNNRVRAPLVALLKDRHTDRSFIFMVNHLYRRDGQARLTQSVQLNEWAKQQSFPVIAVGDYNYDLSPWNEAEHDAGFDALTQENVFEWVKPTVLLPTQCSRYESILDFVFLSKKDDSLQPIASTILYPEASYCKNKHNSDHRPLIADVDLAS